MRVLSLSIFLCLGASVHGLFGKLLAKKKELKKSCRAGEITSYSTEYSTQCDDAVREVCSNECEDKQVSRYEEECHEEVVSQPQRSCKPGGHNQVCQAGHEVTFERQCSRTCKEKKKGPLKELIGKIKEKVVGIISLLKSKRPKEKECEVTCLKVEVGRKPSVQCHNEKVADVCTTEYKDTMEPGKICRQVERKIPQTTSVRVCN